MNKTARQRFEEAGFRCGINYWGDTVYVYMNEKHTMGLLSVEFESKTKRYRIQTPYGDVSIDKKLHKLITYQLKELGWLDE